MPLIAKVPFVSGAVFTPEVATEMTGVTFDDQPTYIGHFNKIADSDLSDAPGAIKSRVALLSTNLKVSAGTGLNANYATGKLLYGTTLYTIGASSISLTASATNYIYGDVGGNIVNTVGSLPTIRALLAVVFTNTTGVVSVTDYREGFSVEVVKPTAISTKNFGGRGEQGSFTAAGGEVLTLGEYYYTDFTVGAGKTITIDKLAKIYCTGSVTIAGTVNVNPATLGGPSTIYGASGSYQAAGIQGQGFGSTTGEIPSSPYSHYISPVGSGGSAGSILLFASTYIYQSVLSKAGGNGGGCFWVEAAGNISVTGTINADGTGGQNGGGVGNNSSSGVVNGASSGGSGGLILFKTLGSLAISGNLSAKGGNGGGGFFNNGAGLGSENGSGGGGGRIMLFSPAINTTGWTTSVAGGIAGTSSAGSTPFAPQTAVNNVGGSFGGAGGSANNTLGAPGDAGVISINNFAAIG